MDGTRMIFAAALALVALIVGAISITVSERRSRGMTGEGAVTHSHGLLVGFLGVVGFIITLGAGSMAALLAPPSVPGIALSVATGLLAGFVVVDAVTAWARRPVTAGRAIRAAVRNWCAVLAVAVIAIGALLLLGLAAPVAAYAGSLSAAGVATALGSRRRRRHTSTDTDERKVTA